ncbi:polymorphic toxin-type HINT domain-containing protein [Micromonospora sp. NPDC049900]|uniref:polymorphic toxin-type HINT domain-containing protein n=1 Tax=Micromonospora sp. NPDC049900 TaxID=3364275 RepID=UPI0037A60119
MRVIDPDDPAGERMVTEWWHKHRVKSVSESDLPTDVTGRQAPPVFTYYEYVGGPAWHYADDDGLTKPKRKTWDQFRGYATVKTRVGDVTGAQTLNVATYLRGMHADRAAPSGGTRTVTVPASLGSETVHDHDQFAGMVREETVYNGSESKPVSKIVNVPWRSTPTASRTINGDTVMAHYTNTRVSYSATALGVDGAAGWRTTRTEWSYDDTYGTVDWTQSDGDVGRTGDEKCTTYRYNRDLDRNLTGTVKQTTTTTLTCGRAPTSQDHILSDTRNYYDGADNPDDKPIYGNVTRSEALKDWSAAAGTVWQTTAQSTFDAFGRVASTTDLKGNVVTTAYTPASGGPVTKVAATRPAPFNWTESTQPNPYWGSTDVSTDQNNGQTKIVYDALGRVSKVWRLGWSYTGHENSPSAEYTYHFASNRGSYPYVQSKVLNAGGGYLTSYQILDSLLRPRQTQMAGVGGGRVVTDTIYDRVGRPSSSYRPHVEPGSPSGALWFEPEWSVPAVNTTVYDNAGRPTAEILLAGNDVDSLVEKWRTTRSYEGNLTRITPPEGGTATTSVVDVQGRTVELRQHTTAAGVSGPFQSTWYTYNGKDQLTKVADDVGNQWTYRYDVRGRQVETVDPDRGATVNSYNDFNELEKVRDPRGEELWYVYDVLGRKTALRDDSATGALRAQWKYDRLYTGSTVGAKGKLTEAYRYEPAGSANIYKWMVGGFNSRYQPTNVNYVVPAVEGDGLAKTWSFGYGYSPYEGSPTTMTYPEGGGLTNETVTTVYDQVTGLPTQLNTTGIGVGHYVASQTYTVYGEPNVTTRKTTNSLYVEDARYYDEATRRIKRVSVKPESATGTVSDRRYDYLPAGNVTSIADAPGAGSADTQCFNEDPLGRLINAWTPKDGVNCKAVPSLANLGGPAPYWFDWTIDAVGNRTKEVARNLTSEITRDYTLPTGGTNATRPHAVTAVTTKITGAADVVTRYAYDNAGNTVCRPTSTGANTCPAGGGSQTLAWDAEGRLSSVSVAGNTVATNIHDADGARWIRRDATGTTLYLPGQELRRDSGGGLTGTRYYSFSGQVCAMRTAGGLTWLYVDHQGTQHAVVAASTQQATIRRQLPYGALRTSPVWPNQKGFVGGDIDPTGLISIGARHYDPSLGRFVSVDPVMDLASPQQHHGYSYANNSPISLSDPSGLDPGGGQCVDSPSCNPNPNWGSPPGGGSPGGGRPGGGNPGGGGRPGGGNQGGGGNSGRGGGNQVTIEQVINKYGCDEFDTCWNGWRRGLTFNQLQESQQIDVLRRTICINDKALCDKIRAEESSAAHGFLLNLGLELSGYNDARACLGGEVSGCAWTAVGLIPVGKGKGALKLGDELVDLAQASHHNPLNQLIACGLKSFSGDTEVLMADGSTKPIRNIKVGDMVLATDPETGEDGPREVTHVWVHEDQLVDLKVEGGSLATTHDHPFWNETDREWQDSQDLDRGDHLRTASGETIAVVGLDLSTTAPGQAYNLTVAGIHTYYVLAGTTPVLVHNDGGELTPEQLKSIRSLEARIAEHQAKLDAYRADPWAYDNQGLLKNAPNDEVRQRIINGRINHLEKEIGGFQKQVDNLKSLGGMC